MRKRLIFNCFSMNVVSHIHHGLWRHPDNTQMHFDKLSTWIELTQLLEKGRFDALFLADVIGIDPAYKGSWDTYVKEGLQISCNDSGALSAALIGVTENLRLTFTSSIMSEHPFSFARRMSTLDHLSGGRISWNIVTSVSHNAAQNFGFKEIVIVLNACRATFKNCRCSKRRSSVLNHSSHPPDCSTGLHHNGSPRGSPSDPQGHRQSLVPQAYPGRCEARSRRLAG